MSQDLTKIRNFGICAHIDAGKTTVSERILFYTGRIHKIGEVHDGTATMDFLQEEQERGITIQSAATTCPWEKDGHEYKLNLIDTPGHVDFTIEVERSLRVLDGAVAVFDGKEGVEAQSETVWRQAERYNVPRMCFINKMDKTGADWEFSFKSILTRLGANGIPIQYPIGKGNDFIGIICLVEKRAFTWNEADEGEVITEIPVPADCVDAVEFWHTNLVEKVAELDDRLDWLVWSAAGHTAMSRITVTADGAAVLVHAGDSPVGWPWLEAAFARREADPLAGKLVICGLGVVTHWNETPAARYLFAALLERLTRSTPVPPGGDPAAAPPPTDDPPLNLLPENDR